MVRALAILVAGAVWGCHEQAAPTASATIAAGAAVSTAAPADAGAKSCADTWLEAHKLNEYGDPPDTMYAGGTPLFDEKTGQRRDRMGLLRSKHPALAQACGGAGKDAG